MDSIFIENLILMARVGVTEAERTRKRIVQVDVAVQVDLSLAMESDSIADTINYASIKREAERMTEAQEFCLLERIGGQLAGWILEHYPVALAIKVTIRKPGLWSSGVPGISVSRFRAFKSNVS
jgi:7,8-dihydroneopterin aldolase/epimerase/oxygenase